MDAPEPAPTPDPEAPRVRQTWRQALTQVAEEAKASLPGCEGRIDQAIRIILAGDVTLHDDNRATISSQSAADKTYTLTAGVCPCPDAPRAPIKGWCQHKLAWALYKRALPRTTALVEQAVSTGETVPPAERQLVVPAHWLVSIQNKPHVLYAGLLSMAHQRGLVGITVKIVSVTETCAVVQATATFKDGQTWTEIGDATPKNVNGRIAPHFIRMAATRAKSRCLRDALNLADVLAVEELGEE